MILDKQNIFSDDQALTTTANSTNIVDLGADDSKTPSPNEKDVNLFAQVTADLETGTSVKVGVYTDAAEGFGTNTLLFETAAIAAADLVAGYKFALPALPRTGVLRYLRLTYTIVGTFDAGTVTAGVVLDEQTNR